MISGVHFWIDISLNYSNDNVSLILNLMLSIYLLCPLKPDQEKNAKYWQCFNLGHVYHVFLHCHIWLSDLLR